MKIAVQRGRKTLWEKEKLLVKSNFKRLILLFSKDLYYRQVTTRVCLGNGQIADDYKYRFQQVKWNLTRFLPQKLMVEQRRSSGQE